MQSRPEKCIFASKSRPEKCRLINKSRPEKCNKHRMYRRKIEKVLLEWKEKAGHKPLVIEPTEKVSVFGIVLHILTL